MWRGYIMNYKCREGEFELWQNTPFWGTSSERLLRTALLNSKATIHCVALITMLLCINNPFVVKESILVFVGLSKSVPVHSCTHTGTTAYKPLTTTLLFNTEFTIRLRTKTPPSASCLKPKSTLLSRLRLFIAQRRVQKSCDTARHAHEIRWGRGVSAIPVDKKPVSAVDLMYARGRQNV